MSANEDLHPIWDRELDGFPYQRRNPVKPGLIRTAYTG